MQTPKSDLENVKKMYRLPAYSRWKKAVAVADELAAMKAEHRVKLYEKIPT